MVIGGMGLPALVIFPVFLYRCGHACPLCQLWECVLSACEHLSFHAHVQVLQPAVLPCLRQHCCQALL